MRKSRLLIGALFAGVAGAAPAITITVNGQPSAATAVVVNGVTYVPLSVLKALGVQVSQQGHTVTLGAATAAPGGANARPSLEGCLGEPLFNGAWRVTVKAARPISRYGGQNRGYALSVAWGNGAAQTMTPLNSGVKSLLLTLQDGRTLSAENAQDLQYRSFVQGGAQTFTLNYFADSAASATLAAPAKLLVEINPAANPARAPYSTATPSFRVRLDCP